MSYYLMNKGGPKLTAYMEALDVTKLGVPVENLSDASCHGLFPLHLSLDYLDLLAAIIKQLRCLKPTSAGSAGLCLSLLEETLVYVATSVVSACY